MGHLYLSSRGATAWRELPDCLRRERGLELALEEVWNSTAGYRQRRTVLQKIEGTRREPHGGGHGKEAAECCCEGPMRPKTTLRLSRWMSGCFAGEEIRGQI